MIYSARFLGINYLDLSYLMLTEGDTIDVEQFAITEEYFKFLFDLSAQQSRSGTPFDPPPANPNNNISNRGLGYFSVAHLEKRRLVVEK